MTTLFLVAAMSAGADLPNVQTTPTQYTLVRQTPQTAQYEEIRFGGRRGGDSRFSLDLRFGRRAPSYNPYAYDPRFTPRSFGYDPRFTLPPQQQYRADVFVFPRSSGGCGPFGCR